MWGGPSHLDTFDPKPEAGNDYCGPLNKPIATNVDGIRIGELLPAAGQAGRQVFDHPQHDPRQQRPRNGVLHGADRAAAGRPRWSIPCVGAVVSLFKGYDAGYKGLIPPYIVLTAAAGAVLRGRLPGRALQAVRHRRRPGAEPLRRGRRRGPGHHRPAAAGPARAAPQAEHAGARHARTIRSWPPSTQCEKQAYDLILGDAGKVFDLSQEKDELRDRYGRNTFGQSCLMARRLVERGVPYVTINYKGWDTHKQHFQTMRRKLPELDKGMATLLQDLSDRGLLDSTIVWWSGEFGRTPKVQWEAPWNGGRGHYGKVFSAVVAGGGFKGGHVVGASDAKGEEVKDRPVYPCDLIGSMYELLGIDPDGQAAASPGPGGPRDALRRGGRDHRRTAQGNHVIGRGGPLMRPVAERRNSKLKSDPPPVNQSPPSSAKQHQPPPAALELGGPSILSLLRTSDFGLTQIIRGAL